MATPLGQACDRTYKATRSSGQRKASDVRWLVLHDEEASTAKSAAITFSQPDAEGSAHLCVDASICYRTLENLLIPWGARSAFDANFHGVHIEQAGFARWSAVLWRAHLGTLRRAAFKTAQACHWYGVPVRFVNAPDLPRLDGVTTHRQITLASKRIDPEHASRYDHLDPGLFWPRRLFMRLVRGYFEQLSV